MKRSPQLVLFWVLAFSFQASISSIRAAEIIPIASREPGSLIIIVKGEFEPGDEQKFANIAIGAQFAVVVFGSNGGAVIPAMEIGKAIRLKGFFTYVPPGLQCLSSCALAWLGGRARLASRYAQIGFHAVYSEQYGLKAVNAPGNALVGAYLTQLGFSDIAVIYVTSAPPDRMLWLSFSDAAKYGIDVTPYEMDAPAQQNPAPRNSDTTVAMASPSPSSSGPSATLRWHETSVVAPDLQTYAKDRCAAADSNPSEETNFNRRQAIYRFLMAYVAAESEQSDQSMEYVASAYLQTASYYGKRLSKSAIMLEYSKFVSRWPDRKYTLRDDSIHIKCDTAGACSVQSIIDWVAISEPRNAKSVGVSTWKLCLIAAQESFFISSIDGKVIDRRITALRSKNEACASEPCSTASEANSGMQVIDVIKKSLGLN
jgi:hypothetical protein